MQIARVRIRNFRCFTGLKEWDVDGVPNRDLNLLISLNGPSIDSRFKKSVNLRILV